jgi:hypothetical protein
MRTAICCRDISEIPRISQPQALLRMAIHSLLARREFTARLFSFRLSSNKSKNVRKLIDTDHMK